jgi:hypothetical protein
MKSIIFGAGGQDGQILAKQLESRGGTVLRITSITSSGKSYLTASTTLPLITARVSKLRTRTASSG